jgi:hypothetical protein
VKILLLACAGLLSALALSRPSFAQSETKQAVAEAIYKQARDLMAQGKLAEACPKFAESQRLDPATGTLLNLAACHEKQGKLATAWLEYSDALSGARRDGRQDRIDYAAEHLAAIEPRVSHLVLMLSPEAEQLDLTLELDGANIGRAAAGVPTAVDPGKHTVRAQAPGKKPWQKIVEIAAETDRQTLTIPGLEAAPAEPRAPASASAALTPPAAKAPGAGEGTRSDELDTRPVPVSVYIGAGVTAALAVGAGVSGIAYLNERRGYQGDIARGASDALEHERKSAQRMGYVNLGLWGATACAAGITTVLYVTRPKRAPAARILPFASQKLAGLAIIGAF